MKTLILIIFLSLQGCAVTPNLNLTYQSMIDYRRDDHRVVIPKFSTANPVLGSYVIIGFDYDF